jgi:hypothetical protein
MEKEDDEAPETSTMPEVGALGMAYVLAEAAPAGVVAASPSSPPGAALLAGGGGGGATGPVGATAPVDPGQMVEVKVGVVFLKVHVSVWAQFGRKRQAF